MVVLQKYPNPANGSVSARDNKTVKPVGAEQQDNCLNDAIFIVNTGIITGITLLCGCVSHPT